MFNIYVKSAFVAFLSIIVYLNTFKLAKHIVSVGTAFTATTVCYGHFVSNRSLETIVANELAGIASILTRFSIDDKNGVVRAFPTIFSFDIANKLNIPTAEAYFIGSQLGCRLTHREVPKSSIINNRSSVLNLSEENSDMEVSIYEQVQRLVNYEFSTDALKANQTRALVILHKGKIIAEGYQNQLGIHHNTPLLGWSMTKSVHATLVGVAIQLGMLNITSIAKQFKIDNPHPCSQQKVATIADMLMMSDLVDFEENYGITGIVPEMLFTAHDVGVFAMSTHTRPINHRAKDTYQCGLSDVNSLQSEKKDLHDWYYSSGMTNILARELRSYFNDDQSYWNFPQKYLFDVLGIPRFTLGTDPSGVFVASSFSYAPARAWAKLGQLYLQRGVWNGKRILSEEFVDFVQTPHPFSGGHYGGSFWLNPSRVDVKTYNYLPFEHKSKAMNMWMTQAFPSDMYLMSGFDGQYTFIVPSLDVVIVRLGFTNDEKMKKYDKIKLFGGIINLIQNSPKI